MGPANSLSQAPSSEILGQKLLGLLEGPDIGGQCAPQKCSATLFSPILHRTVCLIQRSPTFSTIIETNCWTVWQEKKTNHHSICIFMVMSRTKFFFIGHVHFFFVKCFFMSLAHFWCLHSAIWGIMLLEISISSKERGYFLCGVKNKKQPWHKQQTSLGL